MQEILLSYRPVVLFDRYARACYRDSLRGLVLDESFDPELDSLCLGQLRAWYSEYLRQPPFPVRETFDAQFDFPVYSARFGYISQFINSIQPNRISTLWHDRRDILRWYTFWAVVILGGLGLLVALVQTGLGAAQVHLAAQSLAGNNTR